MIAVVLGAAGCFSASGASLEQLRARATFDLQCPLHATEVLELDARTRGVRGCGKQMVYVEVCDNRPDGWHCTWVLNSPAWYVAPPRIPPRPEGTWWWTEPQGVPAPPATSAPIAPPPVVAPDGQGAPPTSMVPMPTAGRRYEPPVAPPPPAPTFGPPPAVPPTPLPAAPLPPRPAPTVQDRGF